MFVKSCKEIWQKSPVYTTISNWVSRYLIDTNGKVSPAVRQTLKGIIVGFNANDFINNGAYKGFCKMYKCNSTKAKYHKKYIKGVGMVSMLGFKIVDYDHTINYLVFSNLGFLQVLEEKIIEEFPEYPPELYLYDLQLQYPELDIPFTYDRCWEHIKGLTPQEKIVLANKHDEEPFPNSFYENDRGVFSRRTQQNEFNERLEASIQDIEVTDNENEDVFEAFDKEVAKREQSLIDNIKEGFDYGDFQDFSDIYTRTESQIEDYELYPIRVNCMPKSIKKRGKSPYDTKLGVREYIWHNMWQKPEPLKDKQWVCNPTSVPTVSRVKYDWEMTEEEQLSMEYDLPEDFWEEIEMAYRNR